MSVGQQVSGTSGIRKDEQSKANVLQTKTNETQKERTHQKGDEVEMGNQKKEADTNKNLNQEEGDKTSKKTESEDKAKVQGLAR